MPGEQARGWPAHNEGWWGHPAFTGWAQGPSPRSVRKGSSTPSTSWALKGHPWWLLLASAFLFCWGRGTLPCPGDPGQGVPHPEPSAAARPAFALPPCQDLKKYGATTVVRVCEVTYDKAPLEKDGITVVVRASRWWGERGRAAPRGWRPLAVRWARGASLRATCHPPGVLAPGPRGAGHISREATVGPGQSGPPGRSTCPVHATAVVMSLDPPRGQAARHHPLSLHSSPRMGLCMGKLRLGSVAV